MVAKRALQLACIATFVFAFVEFVGGRLAGSLALIADAAHLVGDAGALGLAFLAAWIAGQPATRKMSYGFHRVEILAALTNGVGLVTIAIFVILKALPRFSAPREVQGTLMMGFGAAGLLFNLAIAGFIHRFTKENLNIRSAFYHVLGDLLGSVGVVIAAFLVSRFHWPYADPLVSIGIGLLIIWGAWIILRDGVEVLLEAAPSRVNMHNLESRLLSLPGVEEICDLHVWTISSGKEALSVHLGIRAASDPTSFLKQVNEILAQEFGIHHVTIQLEESCKKPHKPHASHRSGEF